MNRHWKILVVDDEPVQRESIAVWLTEDGYTIETAASGQEAIDRARAEDYAIYLLDLKMPPGIDGIETMKEIRRIRPDSAVVIITAYATVDTAVAAMKEGAQEYLVKPCNPQELSLLVERILKVRNLQRENQLLRRQLAKQYSFQDMTSKNPTMHDIFELVRNVARLRSTVLIQGESGTGQGDGRARHPRVERRADKPFLAVPCTALAETLLETELFGHERGAFTGAIDRRKGKFEQADGGTILLDEIGDISPEAPGRAAARAAGAALLPGGRVRGDRGRRARDRRLEREPPGGRAPRELPRRPLLPPERDHDPHPAPARARRGHPAARAASSSSGSRRELGKEVVDISEAALRLLAGLRLARQRARAGERRRACDRRGARARARGGGLRVPDPAPGGAGRLDARRRT